MKKDNFPNCKPEIWHSGDKSNSPILVCGNRTIAGPKDKVLTSHGSSGSGLPFILHGMAIEIRPKELPSLIHRAECRHPEVEWNRYVENEKCIGINGDGFGFEISAIAAKAALREAWRCVECKINMRTLTSEVKVKEKMAFSFRGEGTIFRNVVAFTMWDMWSREGLDGAQRLEILNQIPLAGSFTEKALRTIMEKEGLDYP